MMLARGFWLIASVTALLMGLGVGGPVAAQTAPTPTASGQPAPEAFTARPIMSQGVLSPSGRYLALVARSGDDRILLVKDLQTGAAQPLMPQTFNENFGGVYIDWVHWKGDDRLIVSMRRLEVARTDGREDGLIHTVHQGRSIASMARDGSNAFNLEAPRSTRGEPGEVLDTLDADPGHILMTFGDVHGGLDVAKVDVLTGASTVVLEGDPRVLSYVVDRTGEIVGRMIYRSGLTGRALILEGRSAGGEWTELLRLRADDIRDLPDYTVLGATDKPNQIYVSAKAQPGDAVSTASIRIYDFGTRAMGPPLWTNAVYDVTGAVLAEDDGRLLAGCYWADTYQCDFKDHQLDATMRGLRRFFGADTSVTVTSQSDNGDKWLLSVSSPSNPGAYFLYDNVSHKADLIGPRYADLPASQLGATTRIDYTAADGQALFGYLTKPRTQGSTPAPLVVMPHGGPESRDYLTYDSWAQFLASRGYQVFQPNFRGSSGMGQAFAEAGYRQWGRRMQDDVTAGVQHLIDTGAVDASRICIVGASYGGYAALWGGASQPDLYRCVVSMSGVSDLPAMMRWERTESGAGSDTYEYWLKSIGDPGEQGAELQAVSPIRHAADWRPPLLLIHGDRDDVVPIEQSRAMERALRRAGKPVRLIELENEGHSNWSSRNETRVLSELQRFLGEHLPVAAP